MSTTTPTAPAPATPAQARLYQQLRGHLAALKLHTAAEHLPAVLDTATTEDLSSPPPSNASSPWKSTPARPAASPPGAVRLPAHPRNPGGLRLRRPTRRRPRAHHRTGHLPLPRLGHQHPADRTPGHRQDPPPSPSRSAPHGRPPCGGWCARSRAWTRSRSPRSRTTGIGARSHRRWMTSCSITSARSATSRCPAGRARGSR
jgi:hypothetical protein